MSHLHPLTHVRLSVICDCEDLFRYLSQGFCAVFPRLRTDTSHLNELATKLSPAKLSVHWWKKKKKSPSQLSHTASNVIPEWTGCVNQGFNSGMLAIWRCKGVKSMSVFWEQNYHKWWAVVFKLLAYLSVYIYYTSVMLSYSNQQSSVTHLRAWIVSF